MKNNFTKSIEDHILVLSRGLKLFGLITIKSASETAAIKNMYNNAQARGARIEGESRFFVNKGLEQENKNYILFSVPTLKASGDLVQYMSNKPVEFAGAPAPKAEEKKGIWGILPF